MTDKIKVSNLRNVASGSSSSSNAQQTQKHSMQPLLHISTKSLFRNKRLKQKRAKWKLFEIQNGLTSLKDLRAETKQRQRLLKSLKADVTINLLSDDETEILPSAVPVQIATPMIFQPMIFKQADLMPSQSQSRYSNSWRHKRKRKSQQPRRCIENVTLNAEECIVLTDDDDSNSTPKLQPSGHCAQNTPAIQNAIPQQQQQQKQKQQMPTQVPAFGPCVMQVDEEVTVSLVPRSYNGSCAKFGAEVKPATLPDETVVHTVIANVPYELTLTKLREGLAACHVSETSSKIPTKARKSQQQSAASNLSEKPPAPISLKLSSDLSISLISDDDDADEDVAQQPQLTAELLRQQQPHLSVQQLPLLSNNEANPFCI